MLNLFGCSRVFVEVMWTGGAYFSYHVKNNCLGMLLLYLKNAIY